MQDNHRGTAEDGRAKVRSESAEGDGQVTLVGTVQTVVFYAHGFHVLRVTDESPSSSSTAAIVVTGKSSPIQRGERIRAIGCYETGKHGRQLAAKSLEAIDAITDDGLAESLTGLVAGLGIGRARRLVAEFFGAEKLIAMLDRYSGPGVDAAAVPAGRPSWLPADVWAGLFTAWRTSRQTRATEAQLASLGLPPGIRAKLRAKYGTDALRVVREDPYRLIREIEGVGFLTADDIALKAGLHKDSPERMDAAVVYALEQEASDGGHTWAGNKEIVGKLFELFTARSPSAPFVQSPNVAVSESVCRVVEKGVAAEIAVDVSGYQPAIMVAVSLPGLKTAEGTIAKHLHRIRREVFGEHKRDENHFVDFDKIDGYKSLTQEQVFALSSAITDGVIVITGGPGVGKTTTCKQIVAWADRAGLRIELCAPTARAAKRLAESTGREARTIHRLLEPSFSSGSAGSFTRNAQNPLDADLVLCDETSMCDVELFASLVSAIPSGCRLVLVGDKDQLPPVGPGAPFRDIIESGAVHVARLTKVHRQAMTSAIVRTSHAILAGRSPREEMSTNGDRTDGCMHLVERSSLNGEVTKTIVEIVQNAAAELQCDPGDVMTIAPMRRGPCGVVAINEALQEALNPECEQQCRYCGSPIRQTVIDDDGCGASGGDCDMGPHGPPKPQLVFGKGEHTKTFRLGDRVRQTKNDYQRGIVNGDVGKIVYVEPDAKKRPAGRGDAILSVDFGPGSGTAGSGGVVDYTHNQLVELVLAYCGTIHSVQGSEAPVVVLALVDGHHVMLTRTLLYTAITRGKRACIVVGSRRALETAAKNAVDDRRRTMLVRLLKEGSVRT